MNNAAFKVLEEKFLILEKENSELKRQQVEINQAKELYLKIFEEFPALIWRSGLDKLCDYFNKTWLEFTGRTMEQERGNGWAEGVHPDDFDFCLKTYVEAFDKREPFLMEYRMKNKAGEYRWIRDFGRPFYDLDNSFNGYIGSCYDITTIKDNELALIELNATKDKFFSIIAHDLRNPFNSILGLSAVLEQQIKNNDLSNIEEQVHIIRKASEQAFELLVNLFEWSQSQTGRMVFNPQLKDVSRLIHQAIDFADDFVGHKFLRICCSIPENLMATVDTDMFNAILRNLISNAIKFSHPGGTITVSAGIENAELLVSVKDEGVGIPKNALDRLFKLNEKVSTTGTLNEKGSGLGLVLCKDFIDRHKGRIWVETEPNKGSSFRFILPA
jgi:PAS domain S-box-containing protein